MSHRAKRHLKEVFNITEATKHHSYEYLYKVILQMQERNMKMADILTKQEDRLMYGA